MGWEDIHLHSFILDDQEYRRFVAEDDEYESFENEEEYTIDQLFSEIGQEIDYYYNLEAVWLHTLELEAIEELSSRPPKLPFALVVSELVLLRILTGGYLLIRNYWRCLGIQNIQNIKILRTGMVRVTIRKPLIFNL